MAEDGEILRYLWDSTLPVAFHLSDQDCHSIKIPEPYYSLVPRLSYFSLIIDKIAVYFSQFIDTTNKTSANLWLEYLDIPLKFNYPIGLLYDLYQPDIQLPWNITRFPEDTIVRCNNRSSMESAFLSSLKEADALKRREPIVSTMPKKDHNQLWMAVVNHKFDQFWSINRRLMAPANNQQTFRYIPFRFYIRTQTCGDRPLLIQKLIKPILDSGDPATYRDLIIQVLGDEYLNNDKYNLIVHGIQPEMDTPLQWMSEHLSYLDNFLHIVIHDLPNV
ncbi:autophagy protein 5 isoform X2 [Dermatophagoides pteronyssinus]|uniref:autophagy protein 5 isoform X2 n=1 Tax=Dermatophagoides pteronyssinus TaxID=6956 RepID=UPI003F663D96